MRIKNTLLFIFLCLLGVGLFAVDIVFGSVSLAMNDIFNAICHCDTANNTYHIVWQFRLPKAIAAIICGASLAVAGLLMQTLFANPLAGPYVLGISSGASLGVACLIMGSSVLGVMPLFASWSQILAATIGALCVLILIVFLSFKISDTVSLLIIGMMFGYLSGSVVNILQLFSTADALKMYTIWSMGSLGSVTWEYLGVMLPVMLLGLLVAFGLIKSLNALLLGENYARALGVSVTTIRILVIFATCLLAGAATAFVGPIAFIGIAVPHIARGIFNTSNHAILTPACILLGAGILLLCDIISGLPISDTSLPINSISALIGAPIILYVIIKNKKLNM